MNSVPTDSPKFASLSGSLLARKGGARPAMRRPTAEIPHGAETSAFDGGQDLGWNDMGYDVSPPVDAAPVRLANPLAAAIPEVQPEVKRQQMEIAAKLSVAVEETPAPAAPAAPAIELSEAEATRLIKPVLREITLKSRKQGRGRAKSQGRKAVNTTAAFTLRLDHDRHLKLRLACAVHNVSAQKLITEAVDSLFDSMPEIEPLITRINAQ